MGAYLDGLAAARRQRLARMDFANGKGSDDCSGISRTTVRDLLERLGALEEQLASKEPRGEAEAEIKLRPSPSVSLVQQVVCRALDVAPRSLKGQSMAAPAVDARQMAMHLCRTLTGMSYGEIALQFGECSHTTVLRAHTKIRQARTQDTTLDRRLADLESEIRSQAESKQGV